MHEETSGADGRTRTGDLLFTKQLLYQLSYVGNVDLAGFPRLLALVSLGPVAHRWPTNPKSDRPWILLYGFAPSDSILSLGVLGPWAAAEPDSPERRCATPNEGWLSAQVDCVCRAPSRC